MPRMEAMFVRLTLQVWLFVTTMGLNYQYPKDDIVEDSRRLLAAIRARDVNAAVTAWRTKVDNASHYMLINSSGPHANERQSIGAPPGRLTRPSRIDSSGTLNVPSNSAVAPRETLGRITELEEVSRERSFGRDSHR